MTAVKFYQLRCDAPGCKATAVGRANEVPSRIRIRLAARTRGVRAGEPGWSVVRKPVEYRSTYSASTYVAQDRCPEHPAT